MRNAQSGFALVELLLAIAITGILGSGAAVTIFQMFQNNTRNNDYLTSVSKVESAGRWISEDIQIAEDIDVTGLPNSDFIILYWNERGVNSTTTTVSHVITYYFSGMNNNVGKLMRNNWSSAGINTDTLIADHIYYNAADPDNTTKANYIDPSLTVRLKTIAGDASEVREYSIERRVNSRY